MVYRFAEFELDTERYLLCRRGEPVKVEPKVLELLALLLANRHRLVTKDELLEAVWQEEFVSDAVLTRCIYLARQALDDSARDQRIIRTVHARGYQVSDKVEVVEVGESAPSADERDQGDIAPPARIARPTAEPIAQPRLGRWRRWPVLVLAAAVVLLAAAWIMWRPQPMTPEDLQAETSTSAKTESNVEAAQASGDDMQYKFLSKLALEKRGTRSACAEADAALDALEASLDTEPDFAPGWFGLAVGTFAKVWACGESGEHAERALRALDRAILLAPESPVPPMAKAVILVCSGNAEQAYDLCERGLTDHRENESVLSAAAFVLRYAGLLERSRAFADEFVASHGFNPSNLGMAPNTYLYLNLWQLFLDNVDAQDTPYHRYYRGLAEYLRGRPGEARKELRAAVTAGPADLFGRLAQALDQAIAGHGEAAVALVEQIRLQRRAVGSLDGEITYKQAQILALAGARDEALAELQATVDEGFFCHRCFELDPILAGLRDDPRFEAILEQARQRHHAFAERFNLEPEK